MKGILRSLIPAVALFSLAAGCGPSSEVRRGDVLTVVDEAKQKGEVVLADSTTEGFEMLLPKGTELKALFDQRPGLPMVECEVLKVDGKSDREYIRTALLPADVRSREGIIGFTVSLELKNLGKAVRLQSAK